MFFYSVIFNEKERKRLSFGANQLTQHVFIISVDFGSTYFRTILQLSEV